MPSPCPRLQLPITKRPAARSLRTIAVIATSTPLGLHTFGPFHLWALTPLGPGLPLLLSCQRRPRMTPGDASFVRPSGRGWKQRCHRASPHRGGRPDKQQWEKWGTMHARQRCCWTPMAESLVEPLPSVCNRYGRLMWCHGWIRQLEGAHTVL